MRHDPDFTRAHPCTPLADYPPPSGGFCFSGYFSPKKLHEWRHESRTAPACRDFRDSSRVLTKTTAGRSRALEGCQESSGFRSLSTRQ
jgi:hypothetical protein